MQCFIIEEGKLLLVFIEMIEDRISIFSDCNNGEIKTKVESFARFHFAHTNYYNVI